MLRLLLATTCLLFFQTLFAAEIVSVRPVTNRLLLVEISEGTVIYHENGQTQNEDRVIIDPIDVDQAMMTGNYRLSSADHGIYVPAQFPLSIGRKTKPLQISGICEGGFDTIPYYFVPGCTNPNPDRALGHWIYLTLPEALESGKTYTLEIAAAVDGEVSQTTFTWDDRRTHSEALHVNNLGYVPTAAIKAAYLHHWAGDLGGLDFSDYADQPFYVVDETSGEIAHTGTIAFRKPADNRTTLQNEPLETPNQNFLSAAVWECNFSDFTTPGSYRVSVPGLGASFPFDIHEGVLREAYIATTRALYHNRSGIAKTEPYTEFVRPAAHNPALTPGFANRLIYTDFTICAASTAESIPADKPAWEAGRRGTLDSTYGWYQDAGDWDAYATHLKIPSQLMFTYEAFPENFGDGELNLPESGNGVADILDEAFWLPRFFHRLKTETEAKGWSTGGVGGARVFGDFWGGDFGPNGEGRGSWQDTDRDWYVSGEEPVNTFAYAGMAAHAAYLLEQRNLTDPEGVDWRAEAVAAYTWAQQRYAPAYTCHDFSIASKKNYAAAALYRLTGNMGYRSAFAESWADMNTVDGLVEDNAYGAFIYLSLPADRVDDDLRAEVLANIEGYADFILLFFTENRAMRYGGNPYFPMLIGQPTTPLVFEGIMAYALLRDENPTKAAQYLQYLYTTADYFLGTNPLSFTWITGLGERNPTELFHLDFWHDNIDGRPDGFVPYGPWKRDTNWTAMGPFDRHWAETSLYPADADVWPGHERWYGQQPAPTVAEFTVHQNIINSAVLYGALSGELSGEDGPPSVVTEWMSIPSLRVFPNPSNGEIQLSGIGSEELREIVLLDIGGRMVASLSPRLSVDISGYPAGTYLLRVTASEGRRRHLRVVVR